MIKEVRIRSRKDMLNESYRLDEDCIIISIYDIDKEPSIFAVNHSIRDVLYCCFEDDDREVPESIDDTQAKQIAAFVKKYMAKETSYICYVNCEAGISRSAGTAAAIARFLFKDDAWIFKTKIPNMRCYKKVLEALMC